MNSCAPIDAPACVAPQVVPVLARHRLAGDGKHCKAALRCASHDAWADGA